MTNISKHLISGRELVLLGLLCFSAVDCASGLKTADQYYRRGNYVAAVRSYERHIQAHPRKPVNARVLFRLAHSYLMISGPFCESPRAMRQFKVLLKRFPNSVYARHTRLLIVLHRRQLQLQSILATLKTKHKTLTKRAQMLDDQIRRLLNLAKVLQTRLQKDRLLLNKKTVKIQALSEKKADMSRQIVRLRSFVAILDKIIDKLIRQLAKLKKIDMER